MTSTPTPADLRLLARARLQYELADDDIARLRACWPDLALGQGLAADATAVGTFLEVRAPLARLVDRVEPEAETDKLLPSWQWETLTDAFAPHPPRDYAVAGILPLPSLTLLAGHSGTLKSMLAAAAAIAIATGGEFLPPLPGNPFLLPGYACPGGAVLWVDMDNGAYLTKQRFAALARGAGIQDGALAPGLRFLTFPDPPFLASEPAAVDGLISHAVLSGARLVVLDNLGAISGARDENSFEMIEVMGALRSIAEETGAAVLVIHHLSKLASQVRGHTSILAAVDLALQVDREPGSDDIAVRAVKCRDRPVIPFGAKWTYAHDEAGELHEGRFWGTGVPDSARSSLELARECILRELDEPMNQTAIAALVKDVTGSVGRDTVRAALKALVDEGQLRAERSGVQVLYTLTEAGDDRD